MCPQSQVQSDRAAVWFGAGENGSPLLITRVLSLPQWFPNTSPHAGCSHPLLKPCSLLWYNTYPSENCRHHRQGKAQFAVFWEIHRFSEHGEKEQDRLESEKPDSSVGLVTSYSMSLGKLLHVSRAYLLVSLRPLPALKTPGVRFIHLSAEFWNHIVFRKWF